MGKLLEEVKEKKFHPLKQVKSNRYHLLLSQDQTIILKKGKKPQSQVDLTPFRKISFYRKYLYLPDEVHFNEDGSYYMRYIQDGINLAKFLKTKLSPEETEIIRKLIDTLVTDLKRLPKLLGKWDLTNLVYSTKQERLYFISLTSLNEVTSKEDFIQLLRKEQPKEADLKLNQVLEALQATRMTEVAYNGKKYPVGYHSQRLACKYYRGQRDCYQRLNILKKATDSQGNQVINFQGKRVLDFGCNAGGMLFPIASEVKSACGLDKFPVNIKAANTVKEYKGIKQIQFELLDLDETDYAKIKFRPDIVFIFALTYWLKDWQKLLEWVKKSGALVVLETTAKANFDDIKWCRENLEEVFSTKINDDHLRHLYIFRKKTSPMKEVEPKKNLSFKELIATKKFKPIKTTPIGLYNLFLSYDREIVYKKKIKPHRRESSEVSFRDAIMAAIKHPIYRKYLYCPDDIFIEEDDSYYMRYLKDGIRLIEVQTNIYPLIRELLDDLKKLDQIRGDWFHRNVLYSPSQKKIFNIDLEGFYNFPLSKEDYRGIPTYIEAVLLNSQTKPKQIERKNNVYSMKLVPRKETFEIIDREVTQKNRLFHLRFNDGEYIAFHWFDQPVNSKKIVWRKQWGYSPSRLEATYFIREMQLTFPLITHLGLVNINGLMKDWNLIREDNWNIQMRTDTHWHCKFLTKKDWPVVLKRWFSHYDKIGFVGSYPKVVDIIRSAYPKKKIAYLQTPRDAKHGKNNNSFPNVEKRCDQLKEIVEPGSLWLVSAGIHKFIYGRVIYQAGGNVVDIGRSINQWPNYLTKEMLI